MEYNKMKIAVGIFVLGLFTSISLFIYFLLEEKGVFEKKYSYFFNTKSVDSIIVGMPLKFSGFNVGVIEEIALKDDGSVNIRFSVNEKNRKWFTKGSSLLMKKPLIGSPHIEVISQIGVEPLDPGVYLPIKSSDDINDMIVKFEPAVNKAIKIIDNIEKITFILQSEDSDLKKILQNVEKLTSRLANEDSFLTSLTGDKKATKDVIKSLNHIEKTLGEFHNISQNVNTITKSLEKKIVDPSSLTIKQLEQILIDIKNKLKYIDGTVKTVGSYDKDLVDIKEQIGVSLKKSNEILDKIDSIMQSDNSKEMELP